VALDSILSTAIMPAPPKSAAPGGAVASPGFFETSGASEQPGTNGSPGVGTAHSSSTTHNSTRSSADSSTNSTSSDSSHSATGSSESPSADESSGKRSTRSGITPGNKANSSARSQPKRVAGQGTTANTPTNDQGAAGAQQSQDAGPSFLQALARSQADAEASANAALAPDETAAPSGGKAKTTAGEDTSAQPSFDLLSQTLAAAAMAGIQTPVAAGASSARADDGSIGGLSPAGGPTGSAASAGQSIIASLSEGALDLRPSKDGTSSLKSDADPSNAQAADASNVAPGAFQAQMSVSSHFQHTAAPATSTVEARVGTAAFNDEIGTKITWMASQGMRSASLQLSPEHLGPVDVRISVQNGSATVSFNAMHADTRTALEQALPQLREMFATNGLTLTDASVSQQSPREQPKKPAIGAIGSVGRVSDESNAASAVSVVSARLGLVDTYV
jgi:flagellar hook-length control protein FliK